MKNIKTPIIELFAESGGLGEGFIRCSFDPILHVVMNKNAFDA